MTSFLLRFSGFIVLFTFVAGPILMPARAQTVADSIDIPWSLLNVSETKSGLLANRKAVFLDPLRFQGTTGSDTLRPMQWEVLYGQFRMSAADTTSLPAPSALASVARSERENGRLPIALLWQPFDYIGEEPLQDGRLLVDDSGPIDKVYRPTALNLEGKVVYTMPPPYSQAASFAAGVLYGDEIANAVYGPVETGAQVTFVIPSTLFVAPGGTSLPSTVQVHLRDGNGWRTISQGQHFSTTYTNSGKKIILVRAVIGGVNRHARFILRVREGLGGSQLQGQGINFTGLTRVEQCQQGAQFYFSLNNVHCDVTPGSAYRWAAPRNYGNILNSYDTQNRVAKYDYAVSLAPGHTQITNPIIVVSGFDAFENQGMDNLFQTLVQYRYGAIEGEPIIEGPNVRLDLALKNQGYDIVVMDYADSHDFIQRNALALAHLMQTLHAEMDNNPNSDGEIAGVIGLSTGGLVARYALAYMENEMEVDHRTQLFVSYDSPQQGAYVPVGLIMGFADSFIRDWISILDFFGAAPGAQDLITLTLESPAPQQLLTFWVGTNDDADSPQAVRTQIRRDLYSELLDIGDYPEIVRRVAVANGNATGRRQHLQWSWNAANPQRMVPGALTMDASGGLFLGNIGVGARIRTNNAGPRDVTKPVYRRYWRACFFVCADILNTKRRLTLKNPYDVVPGSFFPSYAQATRGGDSFSSSIGTFIVELSTVYFFGVSNAHAVRHTFIPTVSALDYRTWYAGRSSMVNGTFLNVNMEITAGDFDFDNSPRNWANRTPFDAVYTAGDNGDPSLFRENQPHLFITNGIKNFILSQLTKTIPAPTPPESPLIAIGGSTCISSDSEGYFTSIVSAGTPPYGSVHWSAEPSSCWLPDELGDEPNDDRTSSFDPDNQPNGPECDSPVGIGISPANTSTYLSIPSYFPYGWVKIRAWVRDDNNMTAFSNEHMIDYVQWAPQCEGPNVASLDANAALSTTLPDGFALHGLAPNPARGSATIRYDLPELSQVSLVVYDLMGREIARLEDGTREAGYHDVPFETSAFPAGVYLVNMRAGEFHATERMTIVK